MVRLVGKPAPNIADYLWLLSRGATPREACERIGTNPKALARWFHRRGDREHANPLSALEQRERRDGIRKGPLKFRVYDENGVKL
jgi:hypothetical protein